MSIKEEWTSLTVYGDSLQMFKVPVKLRKSNNDDFPFEINEDLKMEIRGEEIVIRRP